MLECSVNIVFPSVQYSISFLFHYEDVRITLLRLQYVFGLNLVTNALIAFTSYLHVILSFLELSSHDKNFLQQAKVLNQARKYFNEKPIPVLWFCRTVKMIKFLTKERRHNDGDIG